jgi:hypothetical protein
MLLQKLYVTSPNQGRLVRINWAISRYLLFTGCVTCSFSFFINELEVSCHLREGEYDIRKFASSYTRHQFIDDSLLQLASDLRQERRQGPCHFPPAVVRAGQKLADVASFHTLVGDST